MARDKRVQEDKQVGGVGAPQGREGVGAPQGREGVSIYPRETSKKVGKMQKLLTRMMTSEDFLGTVGKWQDRGGRRAWGDMQKQFDKIGKELTAAGLSVVDWTATSDNTPRWGPNTPDYRDSEKVPVTLYLAQQALTSPTPSSPTQAAAVTTSVNFEHGGNEARANILLVAIVAGTLSMAVHGYIPLESTHRPPR